jgi:hypothetical protein
MSPCRREKAAGEASRHAETDSRAGVEAAAAAITAGLTLVLTLLWAALRLTGLPSLSGSTLRASQLA